MNRAGNKTTNKKGKRAEGGPKPYFILTHAIRGVLYSLSPADQHERERERERFGLKEREGTKVSAAVVAAPPRCA